MATVGRKPGPQPLVRKDPRTGRTTRRIEPTPRTLAGVGCFCHRSKLPLGATPGSRNPVEVVPLAGGVSSCRKASVRRNPGNDNAMEVSLVQEAAALRRRRLEKKGPQRPMRQLTTLLKKAPRIDGKHGGSHLGRTLLANAQSTSVTSPGCSSTEFR